MKLRIHKHSEGWVAEIQKETWYGKKYWTHFISVAGIESIPWYFHSEESAMKELLNKIKWDAIKNSR